MRWDQKSSSLDQRRTRDDNLPMLALPVVGRRSVVSTLAWVIVAARAVPSILERATARAGGAALRRVRALRWEGEASIFAGARQIEIGVSTRVVPFSSARSDTWLLREGPTKRRSLIIEPSGGVVDRLGKQSPMPDAMLQHERAQYAIYGLMLLVTLTDAGASAERGPEPGTIIARHPGAPETTFGFDDQNRLSWATNVVPDPETGRPISQRFTFSGELTDRDVHWPARIAITQDGVPYFELRLHKFVVEN